MKLFLDSNAHTHTNPKALQAYIDFSNSIAGAGHPSSPNLPGRKAQEILENSRANIAKLLGAEANQIFFTAGCTQACSWGLDILLNIDDNSDIAISNLEHSAVRLSLEDYAKKYNFNYSILKSDRNGIIKQEKHEKIICLHVQNEIGTIQSLNKFDCKYLFSDISQSIGKIPINLSKLNIDVAALAPHKFGGGSTSFGILYIRDSNNWRGYGTGSRYFLDRTGSPDVGAALMAEVALEEAVNSLEERMKKAKIFQEIIEEYLEKLGFEIIGKDYPRVNFTTFVNIPNQALDLLIKLGEKEIYTGLGSACGSLYTGTSPTIMSLGREGTTHDYMRISQWGEYGEKEAEYFVKTLKESL